MANSYSGKTPKLKTGCGNIYVTVNKDDDGKIVQVLANLGKSGQCNRVQTGVICRLATMGLESGIEAKEIMKTLLGETCDKWDGSPLHPRSCSDAIGRAIGRELGILDDDFQPVKASKKSDGK